MRFLQKEIKLSFKLIVILLLINVIVIGMYYSYALFEISVIQNNVVVIKTGTIDIVTEVVGYSNNTVTLNSGASIELTVNLSNDLNRDINYKLYYKKNSGDTFSFMSSDSYENNIVAGTMNTTEKLKFILKNTGSSNLSLTIGAQAGLVGHDIVLKEGNEITATPVTATDILIDKYQIDSGIVAINTAGALYDGTGEIREYRYSGTNSINNYVIFNNDGDGVTEINELWRIIGIFKNRNGEWNLRLLRDKVLTTDELPNTYVYNGKTYNIENSTTANAVWNSLKAATNYSDWTTAGLQYFLNTEKDTNGVAGYYSTFSTKAKELIDDGYEYYLGNVHFQSNTLEVYDMERGTTVCGSSITKSSHENNCNVWYGNKTSWQGAIGLLYPSDYGYSASSTNWNTILLSGFGDKAYLSSWIANTTNRTTYEWFLSPSSYNTVQIIRLHTSHSVGFDSAATKFAVRPVLNLLSEAKMDLGHKGTKSDPYIIIEE